MYVRTRSVNLLQFTRNSPKKKTKDIPGCFIAAAAVCIQHVRFRSASERERLSLHK